MTGRATDRPSRPKSLADPEAVAARRALLARAAHRRPLVPYLEGLRAAHGSVPDPDPLDGGAEARLLLLLETPGTRIGRSEIVSRDNPTGTAANLFAALAEAGIARRDTLIWNAVPWVIHAPGAVNRPPRPAEIRAGLATLPELLGLLPHLAVVVLAGRVAGMAAPVLAEHRPGLPVLTMPHPSPTYLCTSPAHPARILAVLAEAAGRLNAPGRPLDVGTFSHGEKDRMRGVPYPERARPSPQPSPSGRGCRVGLPAPVAVTPRALRQR